ncbi:MAG TPA: hypothetical protein VF624_04090 [Tepidisphaeraceae bacterium]
MTDIFGWQECEADKEPIAREHRIRYHEARLKALLAMKTKTGRKNDGGPLPWSSARLSGRATNAGAGASMWTSGSAGVIR